jgi:S-adenosylmethionine synthetase
VFFQHTRTSKKIADVRFAHQLTRRLAGVRQQGIMQGLHPDGGMGRHSGGAFSGQDPSKVERSVASMARDIAKSVVAAKLADVCDVQMASVIGHAHPVCVRVETVNPRVSNDKISRAIQDVFDRRPAAIIERLNLLRPVYRATAAYGHLGRPEFPWEASDRVVA